MKTFAKYSSLLLFLVSKSWHGKITLFIKVDDIGRLYLSRDHENYFCMQIQSLQIWDVLVKQEIGSSSQWIKSSGHFFFCKNIEETVNRMNDFFSWTKIVIVIGKSPTIIVSDKYERDSFILFYIFLYHESKTTIQASEKKSVERLYNSY